MTRNEDYGGNSYIDLSGMEKYPQKKVEKILIYFLLEFINYVFFLIIYIHVLCLFNHFKVRHIGCNYSVSCGSIQQVNKT